MEDFELGNNHFLVTTRYRMIHVICKGDGNISYVAKDEVFSPIPWLVDNWGVDEKKYGKVLKVCRYPDIGDIGKDAEVLWYEGEKIKIKEGDKVYLELSDISEKLGIQRELLYIPEIPRISLLKPGYILSTRFSKNDHKFIVFPISKNSYSSYNIAWTCYDMASCWCGFMDSYDRNFGIGGGQGEVIRIYGPTGVSGLNGGKLLWENLDTSQKLHEVRLDEIAELYGTSKENLVIRKSLEE